MVDNPAFLCKEWMYDGFSDNFIDIVNKLVQQNPNARLGFLGIAEIKVHPFFKGFDWGKVYAKTMKPPFTPQVRKHNKDKPESFRES